MDQRLILAIFYFLSCIAVVGSILCYQCVDSTGDRAQAKCQFAIRSLAKQRSSHENSNKTLSKLLNLKNCSNYRDPLTGREILPFCKIEVISSYGEVNGYIRDCSNGSDFSADFRNATHLSVERGFLKLDNQTGCGYSPTHFANLCVSVCNTNFCNGPFSDGGRLRHMTVLEMIGLCLVLKTFQKLLHF